MELASKFETLDSFQFKYKPNIKEIISVIANFNLSLMDNDREFCYLFDKIALQNGYKENELPLYWTIGREIFRYKKEHQLSADTKTNQIQIEFKISDINNCIISNFKFTRLKPSIAHIIEAIWEYDSTYLFNDRKLVQLFDAIALNNGYKASELPKYWNIIRVVFNFKKEKNIKNNENNREILMTNEKNQDISITSLGLSSQAKNALLINNISTLQQLLSTDMNVVRSIKNIGAKSIDEIKLIFDTCAMDYSNVAEPIRITPNKKEPVIKGIDYRILDIKITDLDIIPKIRTLLLNLNIITIRDFLKNQESSPCEDALSTRAITKIYEAIESYGIFRNVKYSPIASTLPDIFYKKIESVFDTEITGILEKYNVQNVGLLGTIFPSALIDDDELMSSPKSFEYIDKITKFFEAHNVVKLPLELSVFQLEDLKQLTMDELLNKNYYKEILTMVQKGLNSLSDREKEIIIKRYGLNSCNKMTLEEVGQEMGLTRERIRQLEQKAIGKIYSNIALDLLKINNEIHKIFEVGHLFVNTNIKNTEFQDIILKILEKIDNINFKMDFKFNLILKQEITAEELLGADSVPIETKEKIEKIIYKEYILIDGHRIKDDKNDIFNYFLRNYCKETIKFVDFQDLYMDFLINNNLSDRVDLLYNDSTLYNKLSAHRNLLLSPGKKIRYYAMDNVKLLIEELNLGQYQDIEISSKKIFIENLELMFRYDIQNEYELHNLLKKNIDDDCIDFSRMPMVQFGNAIREKQIIDLLYQLAPISQNDLAIAYEEKLGMDNMTFRANANNLACIEKHWHNGLYEVDLKEMSQAHFDILQASLDKDFYWKDDLDRKYQELCEDAELNFLNSYNLGRLNYNVCSTCVYSRKYSSLSNYFDNFFENNLIINMDEHTRFRSLQIFYQYYARLRQNLDFIEFSPNMFVSIKKLNEAGVYKSDLFDYMEKVKEFVGSQYFTVTSLREQGFEYKKLDDLGFDDYFYSSILINSKEIQSKQILYAFLMKQGTQSVELSDFLTHIMKKIRKIDIYEFIDLLSIKYGLSMNKYLIASITKESDLYYNQIREKIYFDYDEYYDEF